MPCPKLLGKRSARPGEACGSKKVQSNGYCLRHRSGEEAAQGGPPTTHQQTAAHRGSPETEDATSKPRKTDYHQRRQDMEDAMELEEGQKKVSNGEGEFDTDEEEDKEDDEEAPPRKKQRREHEKNQEQEAIQPLSERQKRERDAATPTFIIIRTLDPKLDISVQIMDPQKDTFDDVKNDIEGDLRAFQSEGTKSPPLLSAAKKILETLEGALFYKKRSTVALSTSKPVSQFQSATFELGRKKPKTAVKTVFFPRGSTLASDKPTKTHVFHYDLELVTLKEFNCHLQSMFGPVNVFLRGAHHTEPTSYSLGDSDETLDRSPVSFVSEVMVQSTTQPRGPGYQIHVWGRKAFTLQVKPSDTMQRLGAMIQKETGLLASDQRLMLQTGTSLLWNEGTLLQNKITENSVLDLMPAQTGGMYTVPSGRLDFSVPPPPTAQPQEEDEEEKEEEEEEEEEEKQEERNEVDQIKTRRQIIFELIEDK